MIRRILLISAGVVLSLGIFLCFAQDDTKGTDKEYIISSNNILDISVFQEPDLSTSVRVSPDGTINYPLLGNIKAGGLTVHELEKNITDLLAEDYLVDPQVTVFVKEYASISILGQVKAPGAYQMKENLSLTQAIALTGGFTETANTSKVKIIRTIGDEKKNLEVNVDQILEKLALDIEVKANDTIIVDEYGRFSVMGQVARPGVYPLRRGLKVVEAVILAGGFTTTAAQDGTRLIRVEGDEKKTIRIPVASIMKSGDASRDISLQDGDTIVVPESFF